MRLITRGRRAPLHTTTVDIEAAYAPRPQAIDWLAAKVNKGLAVPAADDDAIVVVTVDRREQIWGRRCLDLVGLILTVAEHKYRHVYRVIVEADVRAAVGLDAFDPPAVVQPGPAFAQPFPTLRSVPADLRDATVEEIRDEPTLVLVAMVHGEMGDLTAATVELARQELIARETRIEPVSIEARREARAAYDRAYPEGA